MIGGGGSAKKLSSSLSLAVEGGMDFRAMLMKRKKPAKKVVVVSIRHVMLIRTRRSDLEAELSRTDQCNQGSRHDGKIILRRGPEPKGCLITYSY